MHEVLAAADLLPKPHNYVLGPHLYTIQFIGLYSTFKQYQYLSQIEIKFSTNI